MRARYSSVGIYQYYYGDGAYSIIHSVILKHLFLFFFFFLEDILFFNLNYFYTHLYTAGTLMFLSTNLFS